MSAPMNKLFGHPKDTFGSGQVTIQWQKQTSQFVAAVGSNRTVYVFDRTGVKVDSFQIPGDCSCMEWSPDGDILIVGTDKTTTLFIWDANSKKLSSQLETSLKYISILRWNLKGDILAVGTAKGNLLLFERNTGKKTPVVGKHSKAIVSMAWNAQDVLACGGEDKSFTLTSSNGDTILQMNLKENPSQLQFPSILGKVPYLSMLLANKSVFLHNFLTPDSPLEFNFNAKYGSIVKYSWLTESNILIAFSSGNIVVISTAAADLGQEVMSLKPFKDSIHNFAISEQGGKVALSGDNSVKVLDLTDLRDTIAVLNTEETITSLEWSVDGKLLTLISKSGSLVTNLTSLPLLYASYDSSTAYLSGMTELTIQTPEGTKKISTESEPSGIGLGKDMAVWTVGSMGHFVTMDKQASKKEYMGTVSSIQLNKSLAAALLTDGRLQVHSLPAMTGKGLQKTIPATVTAFSLTDDFLVYGTSAGDLVYLLCEDLSVALEFKHVCGIKSVSLRSGSSKALIMDVQGAGFVFEAGEARLLPIEKVNNMTEGLIWDLSTPLQSAPRNLFISYDSSYIQTHLYSRISLQGAIVERIQKVRRPFGLKPILLQGGKLTCLTSTSKISFLKLNWGDEKERVDESDAEGNVVTTGGFDRIVSLYRVGRMSDLWACTSTVQSAKAWKGLAQYALEALDLTTAKRIFRQLLKDPGVVMLLEQFEGVDDKNYLCGGVAVCMNQYNMAQDFFLNSTEPKAALDLRRDLLHWEEALTLAQKLSPVDITVISREYAAQHEFNGKYADAYRMYDQALSTSDKFPGTAREQEEHQIACSAGMTRMTFRLGDIPTGLKMLAGVTDKNLLNECANILEGLKQYAEAGSLFERAEQFEKAADVYLRAKNYNKVGELLPKITSPKLIAQYAKAREAEGRYDDAARAYERAREWDSVVRLYVEKLSNIEGAVSIIRKTRSRDGARLISKFFQSIGDYKATVEFCLMAGLKEEAFEIAQLHDAMETYAEILGNDATPDMMRNIATYFENKQQFMLAGKYLLRCQNYRRAMEMFLAFSQTDPKGIEMAIETVGMAKEDQLTHILIDFLMGETDGEPKDAKYIFQLYMCLGQYREAAKTAVIIAREEQTLGNYRSARDLLLENMRQLRTTGVKIPDEMDKMLMLLHSYMLVKSLVRMDEHGLAARMLIRVASHISKFPAHIVPILTSTVIECYKSNLRRSAFEYAATLMRPEYRGKVDEKYRKKIEQIVRRPAKETEEEEDSSSPCPFCNNSVPDSSLDCNECKNRIPYCIATGKHMVLSEFTCCPQCEFPARIGFFKTLLEKSGGACPMCSASVYPEQLTLIKDPLTWLKQRNNDISNEGAGDADTKENKVPTTQNENVLPPERAMAQ